jgi:acyl dehydratase
MTDATGQVEAFPVPLEDRYFEDYIPGTVQTYGHEAMTEEAILAFARQFDPQTMHTDPVAAADGPFHGLIASGWHTSAVMMRIIVDNYLNSASSLASPGVDELRWVKPVRPGDVLAVRFTVLRAVPSRSKPDRGVVYTGIEVLNQDAEVVMTMTAMNLVRRRP